MAKNLRDKGFSSSMDNYKQQQKKKQEEKYHARNKTVSSGTASLGLNLPKVEAPVSTQRMGTVNNRASSALEERHSRQKTFAPGTASVSAKPLVNAPISTQRMSRPDTSKVSLYDFNRTPALQESYGTYENYVNGQHATAGGYTSAPQLSDPNYILSRQQRQGALMQALEIQAGRTSDAKQKMDEAYAGEYAFNKQYDMVRHMEANLKYWGHKLKNGEISQKEYDEIYGRYEGMFNEAKDMYEAEEQNYAQKALKAATRAEYEKNYDAFQRMQDDYFKSGFELASTISADQAKYDKWYNSIRPAEQIQPEIDNLKSRRQAVYEQLTGYEQLQRQMSADLSGGTVQGQATAKMLENTMNLSDEIERLKKLYDDLTERINLAEEEKSYSRYFYWKGMEESENDYRGEKHRDKHLPEVRGEAGRDLRKPKNGAIYRSILGTATPEEQQQAIQEFNFDPNTAATMTPSERLRFEKIRKNHGDDAAMEYYYELENTSLNTRRRMEEEQKIRDIMESSPDAWAGMNMLSVLTKPLQLYTFVGQTADYIFTGNLEKDASYNAFTYLNNAVRNKSTEDVQKTWGKWGAAGYQTFMSMLDFLYNAAITGGFGLGGADPTKFAENVSLFLMGSEAASDATMQGLERGLSAPKAYWLGVISGAAEIFTEKVSLEKLLDKIPLGKGWKGYVEYLFKNMAAEGSEEGASDMINLVADILISKDQSEWATAIRNYEHQGMSSEDAFRQALLDQAESTGMSMLGGAASGGFMAGGMAAINFDRNVAALTERGQVEKLIAKGQQLDENSKAYKAANDLQAKLDEKGKVNIVDALTANAAIEKESRVGTKNVDKLIAAGRELPGTKAAQAAEDLNTKRESGKKITVKDVEAVENAIFEETQTSKEALEPYIQVGKNSNPNSVAYKSAVKIEEKLNAGEQITAKEAARLQESALDAQLADLTSGKAEDVGRRVAAEANRDSLSQAVDLVLSDGTAEMQKKAAALQQQIKYGVIDNKTAGEVFLASVKLEQNQQTSQRTLTPREVTADMDAFDRSAAETGVSAEEAARDKAYLKLFGVEGEYRNLANSQVNAYYDTATGKVILNANAQNVGLSIIAHEVTHSIEGTASYSKLADMIVKSKGNAKQAILNQIRNKYEDAGIELKDGEDVSEMVAEFVEKHLFTDENAINNLAKTDRTTAEKIRDWIDKTLAKLGSKQTTDSILATLGNEQAQERKFLKQAREYYAKALGERDASREAKAKIAEKKGITLPSVEQESVQASVSKKTEALSLPKVSDEQSLRESLDQMRSDFDQLRAERSKLEQSEEYQRLIDAIVNGDEPNFSEYAEWEKTSGLSEIVDRMNSIQKEMTDGWKKLDQMIEKRMAAEEREAIKKSGLSEAEYFRKQAVKEFGYTPYFYDAGYILPNGKMLNFSGEKGKHFGTRGQDHRAIGTIYANEQGSAAMNRFMNDGNIRIMAESPGLDISNAVAPTREQYATIRRFVNEIRDGEYFNLDFSDERGNNIGSIEYEGRINADRVLNDIRHFFETGEVREQSMADRFRYSVSKNAPSKVNQAMTMQQAKDMIQRAFVLGGIKEWYDGEYKNGDEWLKGVGVDDVALVIDNEWTLQDRYINKNEDILNEEYTIEDVLQAYLDGTLTGKVNGRRTRADLSNGVAVADSRFYAPQQVQAAKETLDIASQRITNSNRAEVTKARAQILLYAHNPGAAETLGLTNAELNKKLRQWTGYSARAKEVSQRINSGVADAYKWTGIENSSWIYRVTVTNDDISRMVNSVEGDGDGYQTSYIARTMLALDTHIDWSWLNIKFDTKSGVNNAYGGIKKTINGYFNGSKSLVHVNRNAPNTVAHEMGHALDYQWATELGKPNNHLTTSYKFISKNVDGDVKAWVDHFGEFCDSLWDSSSIVSEYAGKIEETFARFVDRFVEWTQRIAQGGKMVPGTYWYGDKFTQAQFVEFAKILQEKAALDANGLTANAIPDSKLSLPKTESKQYSINGKTENAVYIKDGTDKNGNTVSFIDLILDGKKLGETRPKKTIPVGEWVGITSGGTNAQVVGRVIFGDPIRITNKSDEYANAYIKGTDYDLKDGESKWYYPVKQVEDFRDNPRRVTKNLPSGARYQYSISPKQDTAYLKAVESGDTETAQRMVDEAAKKAGYTVRKYHGTRAVFNTFDADKSLHGGSGFGYYFGDKALADEYGEGGRVLSVLINPNNIGTLKTHNISAEGFESAIEQLGLSPEKTYMYLGADTPADYVDGRHDYRLATDLQYWANDPRRFAADPSAKVKAPSEILSILKNTLGLDGIERGRELVLWDNTLMKLADPVTYDDNGKVIPLSERFNAEKSDIRYSVSKQMDTDYMAAVRNGDTSTAQKLVDEAAKKAGYTIKAYHGTNQFGFTKIAPSKKNSRTLDGIAFYVTTDPYVAGSYSNTAGVREITQGRGTPIYTEDGLREYAANGVPVPFNDAENSGNYQFYIKPGNILELDAQGRNWNHVPFNPPEFKAMFELLRALRETNRLDIETYEERRLQLLDRERSVGREYQLDFENANNETRKIVAFAKSRGYDGVVFKNVVDVANEDFERRPSDVYALFHPQEQAKSADPVTYDDQGNPIPLSQRFNPENPDIRYSVSKKQDSNYMQAVNTGDMDTASKMVEQAAREAGYNSPKLYHGTTNFGFTKIDPAKGDDGISFFATDSLETANSYAFDQGIRSLKDRLPFANKSNLQTNDRLWRSDDGVLKYLDALGIKYTMSTDEYGHPSVRVPAWDGSFNSGGYTYNVKFNKPISQVSYELYSRYLKEDVIASSIGAAPNKATSVYELYGNTDGLLELDGSGRNWNNIPLGKITEDFNKWWGDVEGKDVPEYGWHSADTRAIAKYAKYAGYQGAIIKNVEDNGGKGKATRVKPAGIYIFFNPASQVKSADPVTYDDSGKVIPLSERFATTNKDLRYSVSKKGPQTESELIDSVIDPVETAKTGVQNALDDYLESAGIGSDIPGMDKVSTGTKRNAKLPARYKAQEAARFFYRKMVDSGEAVTRLGKYSNDPHLYHYYNMARASSNAAVSMIQDAQTDVMGRRVGDGLNDIFKGIRAKGEEYYQDLQAYLFHLHNIDRMSRANPGAVASAQAELEQFRRDNPEIAGMADYQVERLANDPISFYHEQARAYTDILRRLRNAEMTHNKPVFGQDVDAEQSRQAAAELEEKLKQTEGFEEDVEKIRTYIDNLMQYRIDSGLITEEEYERLKEIYPNYVPTFREQEPAARNRRGNTTEIGKTVGRAQGGDTRLVPLHRSLAQQTFSVVREGSKNRFGQMLLDGKQNNSRGMIKNVEEAESGFHEDTFDEEDVAPKKENSFIVRQGGKRYEIGMDNALYEAVTALSPEAPETNFLINLVHKSNDLFKALCTGYNPTFLARNFMRDLQDAGLYSKDLSEFAKQYPLAYKEITTNGKYWQMYKALGGLYSSFFDYQTGELKQSNKVKKYTVDAIEAANMAVEQAPRLAEFMATVKKAEKAGNLSMDTLMEAIYNAADVTVNFGRSGKWGKMFNRSVVPFFNPGVQGFDKMIRNVTETEGFKDWARLAAKSALFGIAPAILSRLLFGKRKDWDEIKQRDKDIYYLFPIKDGVWLKLPKGRVLSVFGMAADRAMQGKDADWGSFIETSLAQTAPENPLTASYWRPWLDAKLFDRDDPGKTWYGSDIENQRLRNLAPGERYDTTTDALSKWLGKTFNLSPKKINYLLDQYTGVIGDVLLPLTSDRAEKGLFTNAFTIDSVVSNQLSEDFYDMKEKLTWAKNNPSATGEDEALYKYWNEQTNAISDINKAIREIEQDKTLTDKEKRELTRVQYGLRNGIMRNALDQMDKYKSGDTDNDIYSRIEEAQAQEARESATYNFKGQEMSWDDLSGRQKKLVQAQEAIDKDKNADLTEILGKGNATTQVARYEAIRNAGISNQTYIDALSAIDEADDGNGNYNQAEVQAGLDQMLSEKKISQKDAATIWQTITEGKNNPYSGKLTLPSVESQPSNPYEGKTYTFKGETKPYSELTSRQQKIVKSQDTIKSDPEADLSDILIGENGKATKLVAGYQEARSKGISNETYLLALTAIDDADNGDGNYSQKSEVNPALQEMVDNGEISKEDASTLWKIFTGGADKNNPFPVGAIMGLRLPMIP